MAGCYVGEGDGEMVGVGLATAGRRDLAVVAN